MPNAVETFIKGLYVIQGKLFNDVRGQLIKPYSADFIPAGLNVDFKEVWFTRSHLGVVRGMHLQVQPYACEKLVSVIDGCVEDVVLDLREASETYGQYFSVTLSAADSASLYIPCGCAHGYKVVSDQSLVMYMATQLNVPDCDVGIRWNSFGYDWNINSPILSEKDKNLTPFEKGTIRF